MFFRYCIGKSSGEMGVRNWVCCHLWLEDLIITFNLYLYPCHLLCISSLLCHVSTKCISQCDSGMKSVLIVNSWRNWSFKVVNHGPEHLFCSSRSVAKFSSQHNITQPPSKLQGDFSNTGFPDYLHIYVPILHPFTYTRN